MKGLGEGIHGSRGEKIVRNRERKNEERRKEGTSKEETKERRR